MAKQQRRYSDAEKAEILAVLTANNGDLSKTAREMDVPRKTLSNWANETCGQPPATLGQEKEVDLASRFEAFVGRVLELTTDDDIKKTPLDKRMVAAGIAVDKAALLRGNKGGLPPGTMAVRITEILVRDAEPRTLRTDSGPAEAGRIQAPAQSASGPEESLVL